MEKKLGVFLSRMQPLHNGHLGMIDKALSENDRLIILVGSSNKKEEKRNPIDISLRREILDEVIKNFPNEKKEKIIIKELPDWSSEDDFTSNLEWGRYLYYNIVSETGAKSFSMYFSDDSKIIEDWFQDKLIRERINLKLFKRANMFGRSIFHKNKRSFSKR